VNGGIMARALQLQFKGDTNAQTVSNMKNWYSEYEDYMRSDDGKGATAIEPIFDIIMKQNIYDFLPKSPKDLQPENFIQRYKILELSTAVSEATDHYRRYIERNPNAKYAKQYKEVFKRVRLFNYLKELYDRLSDVILSPKFKGRYVEAFNLLNHDEEVIQSIYLKAEENTEEKDLFSSVLLLKQYMDQYSIEFGDSSGMDKLVEEAEKVAEVWIQLWHL